MIGTTSGVFVSSLYNGPAARTGQAVNPTLTVAQDMASGGIGAMSDLFGNRIFISTQYFDTIGSGYAIAVIAHELLHNITGKTDDGLQSALGIPVTNNSNNITLKLLGDCFLL